MEYNQAVDLEFSQMDDRTGNVAPWARAGGNSTGMVNHSPILVSVKAGEKNDSNHGNTNAHKATKSSSSPYPRTGLFQRTLPPRREPKPSPPIYIAKVMVAEIPALPNCRESRLSQTISNARAAKPDPKINRLTR